MKVSEISNGQQKREHDAVVTEYGHFTCVGFRSFSVCFFLGGAGGGRECGFGMLGKGSRVTKTHSLSAIRTVDWSYRSN